VEVCATIPSLIIPAVVAGGAAFVASALVWMLFRWHDKDIQPLPDEAGFMDSLKKQSIAPGFYMWPNCTTRAEHGSDAFKARWSAGPWGTINVLGAQPNFARNLGGSLLINIVIAFGTAVAIGLAAGGADAAACQCAVREILLPAFLIGLVAYCLGGLCGDLFLGKPARFMLWCVVDGVLFAAAQAVVLWAMWPYTG